MRVAKILFSSDYNSRNSDGSGIMISQPWDRRSWKMTAWLWDLRTFASFPFSDACDFDDGNFIYPGCYEMDIFRMDGKKNSVLRSRTISI